MRISATDVSGRCYSVDISKTDEGSLRVVFWRDGLKVMSPVFFSSAEAAAFVAVVDVLMFSGKGKRNGATAVGKSETQDKDAETQCS